MMWMEIGFWPYKNKKYKLWASQILCSSRLRISHFFQRFPSKAKHFWSKDYSSPFKKLKFSIKNVPLQTICFLHPQTSAKSRFRSIFLRDLMGLGESSKFFGKQQFLEPGLTSYYAVDPMMYQNLYIFLGGAGFGQSSCRIWDRNLEPAPFTLKKMVKVWTF